MKLLIDMNLTPGWCEYFHTHGVESQHWSMIGPHGASDAQIMGYAREHGFVVSSHDLDFGAMLAATHASGPSVIQVRCIDPTPKAIGSLLLASLAQFADVIASGAIVVIEPGQARARVLPIR